MDIRPTQPDDLNELSVFLTEQGMPRTTHDLNWKFLQSPGEYAGPKSWVAKLAGQIVGHIGIMPTCIHPKASHPPIPAAWFVDWMVREDVRSRGIGVFLLREAGTGGLLMTIQGSVETQRVLPQLGWSAGRGLQVHKLNVRAGFPGMNRNPLVRLAAETARWLYFHPVRKPAPRGWALSDDESDWSQLENVMQRLQGQVASFDRSAAFLRWHFQAHPSRRYHLLLARDPSGPCGYAVWRIGEREDGVRVGRLVDAALPGDEAEGWSWLISEAVSCMVRVGAGQIECLAGEGSPLEKALQRNRFLARLPLPLWMSSSLPAAHIPHRWHATFADSDIDSASRW